VASEQDCNRSEAETTQTVIAAKSGLRSCNHGLLIRETVSAVSYDGLRIATKTEISDAREPVPEGAPGVLVFSHIG
jgi:hypothetical protein